MDFENPKESQPTLKQPMLLVPLAQTSPKQTSLNIANSFEVSNEENYMTLDFQLRLISLMDTNYVFYRIFYITLGKIWFGYYWVLYNELFYHITSAYGISELDKDSIDWIHGSINAIFFGGCIIGSLLANILPKNFPKIKFFMIFDILAI